MLRYTHTLSDTHRYIYINISIYHMLYSYMQDVLVFIALTLNGENQLPVVIHVEVI